MPRAVVFFSTFGFLRLNNSIFESLLQAQAALKKTSSEAPVARREASESVFGCLLFSGGLPVWVARKSNTLSDLRATHAGKPFSRFSLFFFERSIFFSKVFESGPEKMSSGRPKKMVLGPDF